MINANLKSIADHYGYENQSMQLIEEMAELTQAINKLRRCDNEYARAYQKDHIAEEIADVEIMLEQVKDLLGCQTDVTKHRVYKIDRQLAIIRAEKR